jgi:hypothetical protein
MKANELAIAIGRAITICALATSTVLAQSSTALPEGVGADVGTGWNILSIPAAAFVPQNSSWSYHTDSYGYVYPSGASIVWFHAPVSLPSGAGIGFLNLYAYDPQPGSLGGDVAAFLMRLTGYGSVCTTTLCPDSTVTRRQMAAFFARALGLYREY